MDVIDILADVPRVCQDGAHRGWRPLAARLRDDTGVVEVLGDIEQGLVLLVQFGHAADGLGLLGDDGECLCFLRPRIAEGNTATIPLTV